MPSKLPAPPPEEYLAKDIAAQRLGLSIRRLMELSQAGKIERHYRTDPKTGRDVAIFAASAVDRLKAGLDLKIIRKPHPPAGLAAVAPARLVAPAPVLRPWLTLAEAADYSGLPAGVLRDLIESGKLRALNVGVRPGGVWRVRRAELDAFEG